MGKRKTTEEYIKQANNVHNGKYDYSKLTYNGDGQKVCIICPIHGEFWQNAGSHLKGIGCPKCSGTKKLTTEEFINKAIETHGNRYDYSKSVYNGKRKKVNIICQIHGQFEQLPLNHIRGQGCPECGKKFAKEYRKNNYTEFINESISRFGDIYEFLNIENEYENSHSKIHIKCKKCGNVFVKIACDHLTSPHGGCLHCYANKSKSEEEIGEYIKTILPNTEIMFRSRNVLSKNELDIFIPSMKIAFEYNGIYWHSEKYKNKNYHLCKLEECNKNGIKLVQIFEDEFLNKKEIVLSKIKHILGKDNSSKIYGRKCIINEIDYKTSKNFLDKNHIQGSVSSSIYLGAFYDNSLVGVMTFKKDKDNKWDLNRFATDKDYNCIGVGGKLFKHFIKTYNPKEIKSFADRRWTSDYENNLYTCLGFRFAKFLAPDYHYVIGNEIKRHHKFNFRKKTLSKKYNLPLTMTETEMAKAINLHKIYDCGLIKYVWKNDQN